MAESFHKDSLLISRESELDEVERLAGFSVPRGKAIGGLSVIPAQKMWRYTYLLGEYFSVFGKQNQG